MKKLTLSILTCLIFLSPNVVLSETLSDLVKTDGLYYKKFSQVPFTGKITEGLTQGSFRNGKWDGPYVDYHSNGRVFAKGTYKNGIKEGEWVWYDVYGERFPDISGTYKNGKQEGSRIGYFKNGLLRQKGNYKNGNREGPWAYYYENGQLMRKGTFKNGFRNGAWVYYNEDGTLNKFATGTFKNEKKVSD
jgi:antitoxin component YwqK of YwqJK toxin-antitoxin module